MISSFQQAIPDSAGITLVDARPAQDAFIMLHSSAEHHTFNVQAHGTILRTQMAVFAHGGISPQAERRPLEQVTHPPPRYHEGRHPADMMAERSFADRKRKDDEERHE
jgi:hypothetical protein